jgi:CheY-specific phosphatase CheX
MWREQAGSALADAATEVLETMCFVATETVVSPVSTDAVPIASQVEFRGAWTGRCMVQMPEACARTLASNFVGISDPAEMQPSIMIEMLCEFANMVCGGTISRLKCPGLVALAPPHLIWAWPDATTNPQAVLFERYLDTGEGVVRVGFEAWNEA